MANFINPLWWVIPEQKGLRVYNSKGEIVEGEVWCRVTDAVGEQPYAIFKAIVNVASSVEEMNNAIEEMNNAKDELNKRS